VKKAVSKVDLMVYYLVAERVLKMVVEKDLSLVELMVLKKVS
jgi:hypothetical protein